MPHNGARPLQAVAVCVIIVALVACGTSSTQGPAEGASATFSVTYSVALRAITDLGLVPAASVCGSGIRYESASGTWWQPVGAEAAFDTSGGQIVLWPTPLAAPDWPNRLSSVGAHLITIYPHDTPFNCPSPRTLQGAPPADASHFVTADQLGTYAHVTFSSGAETYDAALNAVTDLGLRLADPCYERAQARGAVPAWHTMGQESGYAGSAALVVAPTSQASANWQNQIQALAGVVSTQVPFSAQCS